MTVRDVEARIDLLRGKGLLLGDGSCLMTTEAALRAEQRAIALARAGLGASAPLLGEREAAPSLQAAARELGLRRLNPGQEAAGVRILTSANRLDLVQGGAGVGKSASLAPVARLAIESGRPVHALAHAGRTARDFGAKLGAPASTVDSFLARYSRVLDGTATPQQMARAKASLAGAVLMVDEASQVGTDRLGKLIDLANRMDVARLVLSGDTRQLQAIEAGKPFEQLQRDGLPIATIVENLRAASPQMRALNQALDRGDIGKAFAILKPDTLEVPFANGPATAAKLWVDLPAKQRDATLLLASGRAMRAAANAAVQAERIARGELRGPGQRLTVLDRVTITREGARQMKAYRAGRIVAFRTDLPSQGISRGDRGAVQATEEGRVSLAMADGARRSFEPGRLPRNLAQDAVTIHEPRDLCLYPGDRIRWTDNDRERGLLNGDLATVERLDRHAITVRTNDGQQVELSARDPMRERLDLAYAVNVHIAQGMTTTNGIVLMSEREKPLNTARAFLVAVTRIAERATLIVDNVAALERDVGRQPGDKASAIETALRQANDRPAPPERERVRVRERDMELGL